MARLNREYADRVGLHWHMLAASVGGFTLLAQIVYALVLFGLPAVYFHLLWVQEAETLPELLSSPLMSASRLTLWCAYGSSAVILIPTFSKARCSRLALLLPIMLIVAAGLRVYLRLFNLIAADSLRDSAFSAQSMQAVGQVLHLEPGIFVLTALALYIGAQGLRGFFAQP
jgi:hypothetical protein